MGSCTSYDENCVNWKFENLLESKIMPICCSNMCTLFWYVLECWIRHGCWCTCVNKFRVCISRSGEPGSPRREWQRRNPCVTRSSRVGEGVWSWATGHLA